METTSVSAFSNVVVTAAAVGTCSEVCLGDRSNLTDSPLAGSSIRVRRAIASEKERNCIRLVSSSTSPRQRGSGETRSLYRHGHAAVGGESGLVNFSIFPRLTLVNEFGAARTLSYHLNVFMRCFLRFGISVHSIPFGFTLNSTFNFGGPACFGVRSTR